MTAFELWQVLITRSSAASQEIELWAPCVGNRMHFLLGNLFCALPRKSSGKKDAQACRAGKEMVALQLGEAGQTHSCQHKVTNSKFWMTTKHELFFFFFRERNTAVTSYYNQTTIDQAKKEQSQWTTKDKIFQAAAKPSVRLTPATIMYSSMQMDSRQTSLVNI